MSNLNCNCKLCDPFRQRIPIFYHNQIIQKLKKEDIPHDIINNIFSFIDITNDLAEGGCSFEHRGKNTSSYFIAGKNTNLQCNIKKEKSNYDYSQYFIEGGEFKLNINVSGFVSNHNDNFNIFKENKNNIISLGKIRDDIYNFKKLDSFYLNSETGIYQYDYSRMYGSIFKVSEFNREIFDTVFDYYDSDDNSDIDSDYYYYKYNDDDDCNE